MTRIAAKISGELCDKNIANATAQIEKLLQTTSGRNSLYEKFSLCSPIGGSKDASSFMLALMGSIMTTVQYNGEIPRGSSQLVNTLKNFPLNF